MLAPLFLTQCKTTAKSYKDVSYDPAKLKTPSGHGLERKDYPFDEGGNYRKDWVKGNASGRDRSALPSTDATPTQVASATSTESATPAGPATYPTYAEASAARSAGEFLGPVDAATDRGAVPEGTSQIVLASAGTPSGEAPMATVASSPVVASYHKVSSGDTLFSLAGRYNTSVADLKRVNGLTGDSIRIGQSLRIP